MKRLFRVLRPAVLGLALMAISANAMSTPAQTVTPEETTRAVRRMLERLPYYGVFDYLVFSVDRGVVGLAGYSFDGRLKAAAEMAVKRVSGVEEVSNRIEVLPTSQNDDRIRWATYYRIYTDDFLSRYSPGGAENVFREINDEQQFPGMNPVGPYAIHIIVKNGRTMLLGFVNGAVDRQLAEVRAREVTGTFDVENSLAVARP
jgi:hyperosmotically inducible periplasmic protein